MSAQEDAEDRRALAANIAMSLIAMLGGQLVDAEDAKDTFLDLMRAVDSAIESGFADPVETEH